MSRFSVSINEFANGFDVHKGFFPEAAFADVMVCIYLEVAGGGSGLTFANRLVSVKL